MNKTCKKYLGVTGAHLVYMTLAAGVAISTNVLCLLYMAESAQTPSTAPMGNVTNPDTAVTPASPTTPTRHLADLTANEVLNPIIATMGAVGGAIVGAGVIGIHKFFGIYAPARRPGYEPLGSTFELAQSGTEKSETSSVLNPSS